MLDRTKAPEAPRFQSFSIKQVDTSHVGSIPVYFLKSGDQPIIRLEFVFKAGSWYENKNGLSFLTAKMLSEGSQNYSSKEIAEKIANNGAFLEIHHGLDVVNVTFFLLEKHILTLFPIIVEVLTEPIFPEHELANLKNITNQNLEVNKEKGQFLSSVEFRKVLFGNGHPYGRQYWQEDISKIDSTEIAEYYRNCFHTGNLEIFASGQFDGDKLLGLLENYFHSNATRTGTTSKTVAYNLPIPNKVLVEKPDFLQSSIRIGRHTAPRASREFPDLMILNEIFGGFFGSRLMKNIREDKGYTYGIHSSVHAMHQATYLVVGTDVKKENTVQTLEEMWKEMRRLQTELVKEDELDTVKAYMLGKFVNSINTPFSLMDKFKIIHFAGLEYKYFDHYMSRLQAISPLEVRELALNTFKEEEFCQVVVGGIS